MCTDNKPCEGAGKKPNGTDKFLGRLEMLIVSAEAFETHNVEVPHAAIALVDVIGPMLMDTLQKAKGWSDIEVALMLVKQRGAVYRRNDLTPPDGNDAIEAVLDLLAQAMKKPVATPDQPAAANPVTPSPTKED